MICNNCKFFSVQIIFKIFNRPYYSQKFKFVYAIALFTRIQKTRCKCDWFPPINCQLFKCCSETGTRRIAHFTRVSSCGLLWLFAVAFAMRFFISLKQFSCSSVQMIFDVFFSNGRRGWLIWARFGKKFSDVMNQPQKRTEFLYSYRSFKC